MRVTRLLVVLIVLASGLAVGAEDKAFFFEFEPRSGALASATNATGAVVVGGFDSGGGFYWMPTTGVISLGGLTANGVSADGHTIIGVAPDARGINNAAIWQRAAEWRLLGAFPNSVSCDTSLSNALGVSRDGAVVVGLANINCVSTHAFRWEASTGMTDLGSTVAGANSVAKGVSGDGKVVVGYQRRADGTDFGVRWVDGRQESFAGPIGQVGQALATNWDGSVIVGRQCRYGLPDQTAWMWTSRDGVKCLQPPGLRQSEGFVIGYANAVSDSARVVGGGLKVGTTDSEAVIWIDGQPFLLKDYLRSHGVPDAFERYIVSGEITGISPDGRILVGYGAALGGYRGYMVILNRLEPQP